MQRRGGIVAAPAAARPADGAFAAASARIEGIVAGDHSARPVRQGVLRGAVLLSATAVLALGAAVPVMATGHPHGASAVIADCQG